MDDYKTPGQLIEKLLQEKGWSQQTLAVVLEKGKTSINKIVVGKQAVDVQTALMLEDVFGISAATFLALQRDYDLAVARLSAKPDPARAQRAQLYSGLPITEMIKRGWLDATDQRDARTVESALTRFFGVSAPSEIEVLPHAAKKTKASAAPTLAQLAWLYRVKQIAAEMLVPKYSPQKLRATLPELKSLMIAPEQARLVPRLLADCGVRFLLVEGLPSAKIDGVCFWIKESPVVALAMRHDRIDNFWFVLRHELEHVLQGHGKQVAMLDAELECERAGSSEVPEEEQVANDAATDFCVDQKRMEAFIARKAPLFSERDLLGFSKILKVHPGIVAGQLQHRTGRFDRFRQHMAAVRSCVSPNAVTDGWGDIYPLGT